MQRALAEPTGVKPFHSCTLFPAHQGLHQGLAIVVVSKNENMTRSPSEKRLSEQQPAGLF